MFFLAIMSVAFGTICLLTNIAIAIAGPIYTYYESE